MKGSDLFLKSDRTNNSHRGIIVGFDPGLTVGIAILNLDGNLISLASCKEIRRSEIISHIITYGKTVLVATDVYPIPKTVKKLATTLNSKIWSPYKCMSIESKIDIVDSYLQYGNNKSLEIPQNAHERDALAAAVKTYRDHVNKFRQIIKRAEKAELDDRAVESVKMLVINGISISNAIKRISEDIDKENTILKGYDNNLDIFNVSKFGIKSNETKINTIESTTCDSDDTKNTNKSDCDDVLISRFKHKLKSQKRYIDNLKRKNILLEEDNRYYKTEISKLQSKVDKLHYNYTKKILQKKEVSSKIAVIKRIQEKYNEEKSRRLKLEEELRSLNEVKPLKISGNNLPVKIIEFFTKEGIREACDKWEIRRDDIVLLKNSEGGGSQTASLIINLGVKAVITMDKISDPAENIFEENMIPLIPANSLKMTSMTEFYLVNSKDFKMEIEKWKEHINSQKEQENNKNILKLVDEYRAQRRRP
jgi:predicted RNase H-like nuclease (RuvC/YqgF family)